MEVLMLDQQLAVLEQLFLALSDKTRMRLLLMIAEGEASVGYLAGALCQSQPKISRHLAYLRQMGLVTARRDGKWIYYKLDRGLSQAPIRILDETLTVLRSSSSGTEPTQFVSAAADPALPDHGAAEERFIEENDPHSRADSYWEPAEIEVFLL
jgi:ArsR family transcriptional regulator, arsenate/arsenite/antimonite-responsive transcriptional repressor